METIFKIAKYSKVDDSFIKLGYDEYKITYLRGVKVHQLRIVVNGYLSKRCINLVDFHNGYKKEILFAIKEYQTNHELEKNTVTKKISFDFIKTFYSKQIVKNIENYLLKINKEESRDRLTKFELI